MNENHKHDKALEDAIERLVHGKHKSGNELLDSLGTIKPKADPSFMANLEDRLMAEFSSKEREIKMEKRKERPQKYLRWPLTMAAAVFAILLVGGFAIFMQQNQDDSAAGIVMNPVQAVVAVQAMIPGTVIEADMVELRTFTPDADLDQVMLITDIDLVVGRTSQAYVSVGEPLLISHISADMNSAMVPVVIAIQDIPEGTEITEDMVEIILFPAANAPNGAFADEEDVVGLTARTTIYTEEIILVRKVDLLEHCDTPQVGTRIYEVRAGDTLFNIAEANNIQVSELIALNCLEGVSGVHTGQLIRIPSEIDEFSLTATAIVGQATEQARAGCPIPQNAMVYGVQEGDTLYSVARDHNVAANEIFTANCLASVADITVGDLLYIPHNEIDDFSLTATAIVATATASADFAEAAMIVPNAPEPLGCHNDNARILYPLNGQLIDAPVLIRAIATNENFAQSRIEISGPSTNEQFVVIASIAEQAMVETDIGQFVPAAYQAGQYQLRLNTFNNINSQVGTCTITIYISNQATTTGQENLRPVVIAVRDIPMNTVITEDMVMLSYWPDAVAMQFAMENNGQWYLDNLEGVIGKRSTALIPAFEPISNNLLIRDSGCNPPCAILPSNRVAIALRNNDESIQNLIIGQSVDVIVSFNYQATNNTTFQVSTDGGELTMQRVVSDAQVIWVGGDSPDFWNVEPDAALLADERLIVVAVTAAEATTLQWITEAGLPILVVPAIEEAEAVEIQQSSSGIQIPENYLSMTIWMDASAMTFEAGEHVDVFGTFTYINASGQIEGVISQRMAVDYIVLENVAGTGDMARFVEVTLAAPIGGTEFLNSDSSSSDYTVFQSWTLLPHNPDYVDTASYIPALDSSLVTRHFAAVPLEYVTSVTGGFNEGDRVRWNLPNGDVLEGTIAYFGAATYAPFIMQPGLDSYRMANPRVLIMEFSSAEEAAALLDFAATGQSSTIEILR